MFNKVCYNIRVIDKKFGEIKILNIGTNVYVKYKGSTWHGTIISYEFPRYLVELSNGLELSFYEDEIERA